MQFSAFQCILERSNISGPAQLIEAGARRRICMCMDIIFVGLVIDVAVMPVRAPAARQLTMQWLGGPTPGTR